MKRAVIIFIVALVLSGCHKTPSSLTVPSVIGDNMLIQRDTEAGIWGKAAPGQEINITASWGEKSKAIAGMDGKWSARLKTPGAGGPYTIDIAAYDTTITVKNVMTGEVWICSGQSNMEMPMAGWPPVDTIMHATSAIASSANNDIRLFIVERKISAEPLDDCGGRWLVCDPETVKLFSAVGYFFGRRLNREMNVPVGLIESSWGGTPVESWIPSASLLAAGEFRKDIEDIAGKGSKLKEYVKWLEGHKQTGLNGTGEDTYKDLHFDDDSVPLIGFDDSGWNKMELPANFETQIGEFDGAVWYRKTIDIPAGMKNHDLVLSLGPVDDMDRTYFNGTLVGSNEVSGVWQLDRFYNIPAGIVKEGKNVVAVRVIDTQGGGGIWGKPAQLNLSEKNNKSVSIPLAGEWKYKPVAEFIGNKFYIFDLSKNDFSVKDRPRQLGPNYPTVLYNGMINPVVPYSIRGAIWYQGETNVGRAGQYAKIFPVMIKSWRKNWDIKDFPFYFVQIAPYVYSGADSTEAAYLREAQQQALKLPHTGMVVTLDIATVNNIHPPYKIEVGDRLANLALNNDYGISEPVNGPEFKSATREGKSLRVVFDHTDGGLVAAGGKLKGFEIAGKNGKYVRASASISGNTVIVSSPDVPDPVSVRYCWHNGSVASLFNKTGLPALQFRSDNKKNK
ncbi:MAG TPA: sialate O-acetylesterase [Bacteroidales bacterium]|nr:sialate O-acetylesterase [Bacteroidales bacterium]